MKSTETTELGGDDMPAATEVISFDLAQIDQEFLDDPFPTYKRLREIDPVHLMPDGSYFLTRYADLNRAYRDPTMSSEKKAEYMTKWGLGSIYDHHTTSLVFNDPPYHTRVRNLVAAAFTPRSLAALEPQIRSVVADGLARIESMRQFDLIEDFAIQLPTEIIGVMLGIPRGDRHLLRGWSMKILGALDPIMTDERIADANAAVEEFSEYLRAIVNKRRADPNSAEDGEVLTALIFGEVDGESLSEPELIHNCIFMLNAGHETTTSLIGHGIHILLENPDELRRLVADPSLIKTAVEEFLRYQSPVQIGNRKVTEKVEIGGVTMPPGTYLHLAIGAANRDPEEFPDPDRVDITRTPNRHLAFIAGRHICMGNTLGRMEAQIAIGDLIARFPELRREGEPEYFGRARFRGFDRFPCSI